MPPTEFTLSSNATSNRTTKMRTIESVATHPSSFMTVFGRTGLKEISAACCEGVPWPVRSLRHRTLEHLSATQLEPQLGGMTGYLCSRSEAQMLEETRSRSAEFYFNGACLVRAIFGRKFRKISFFLRHLWCAITE